MIKWIIKIIPKKSSAQKNENTLLGTGQKLCGKHKVKDMKNNGFIRHLFSHDERIKMKCC